MPNICQTAPAILIAEEAMTQLVAVVLMFWTRSLRGHLDPIDPPI